MTDVVESVETYLASAPVGGGMADATRRVERVGFLITIVRTRDGVEGVGVTYHEVGGEATRSLIDHDIAPRIVGRDPFATEALTHELVGYTRGVGRKGLTFAALSAIDIALWDIKGKILGMPLYRLFGGVDPVSDVYASGGWTSYSDEELVAEAVDMVDRGYRAIKLKVGVESGRNPSRDVLRLRKVRDAVGFDIDLMLDANNCWDAATAARFANRVAELEPVWLEEPVFADDIPGLARFKRATDIPLATGEHEYTRYGVRDLLIADAVDIVQADITRAGGFTEMLKIAALTQAWNVLLAPHAMENIHHHLVAAYPHARTLERLLIFEKLTANVFPEAPLPHEGRMTLTEAPGLGLAVDLEFVQRGG